MIKICVNCEKEFSTKEKRQKFCSLSCSASTNNKLFPKKMKTSTKKTPIPFSTRREIKIRSWLDGNWNGGNAYLSKTIRKYLLEINNFSCSKCGFNKNHPDDGKSILEINHIDGNGTNHKFSNLEVLCPNCHALTSSYRGRNYGNGRPIKYLRIESV